MTDVRRLIESVRSELRTTVLPKIEGEYERSVMIAMLGILGDLRDLVALDERPIAAAAAVLRRGCGEWIHELGSRPLASRLSELVGEADATVSTRVRHERLLEATETFVRELWRDPELGPLRERLLPRIRSALRAQFQ